MFIKLIPNFDTILNMFLDYQLEKKATHYNKKEAVLWFIFQKNFNFEVSSFGILKDRWFYFVHK